MSDEKRCCANTRQHVQQEVLHLAAGQGVERTEWFIEQQDPWLDHQSSGYHDPLLHAAGQLIDAMFLEALQPGDVERFVDATALLVFAQITANSEAEGDIAENVKPRVKHRVLKGQDALLAGPRHLAAIKGDAALGRVDEACREVEKRALAAATRTDNGKDHAIGHVESVRTEGMGQRPVARCPVCHRHAFDSNHLPVILRIATILAPHSTICTDPHRAVGRLQ